MGRIESFNGPYSFLANFAPCSVMDDLGLIYPTVENAYQASKALDKSEREAFITVAPGAAKRLGSKLPLRPDWELEKLWVMFSLLMQKFSKSPLKDQLLETAGSELVEGNNWGDTYWGVCNGVGQNMLGKLLMAVRDEMVRQQRETSL
jgi:ribA/ribD-fused uncharacterized protein